MSVYTRYPARLGRDNDYVICCEGLELGRVYEVTTPEGERWLWMIYVNAHVPPAVGVPIAGRAVDLDSAAEALKHCYEQMRTKAGLPKPQA